MAATLHGVWQAHWMNGSGGTMTVVGTSATSTGSPVELNETITGGA
jgi:hypothetical protein